MTLAFDAASVRNARRRLASELAEHDVSVERAQDALLVVSELVGNALRHARPIAGGGLQVGWRWQPSELELFVTDGGGPSRPRALRAAPSAVDGRGLAIVSELAAWWTVERHGTRTLVRAVVPLSGPADGPAPAGG